MQDVDLRRITGVGWIVVVVSVWAAFAVAWPIGAWVLEHIDRPTFREYRWLICTGFAIPVFAAALATFRICACLLGRRGILVARKAPDSAPSEPPKPLDVRDLVRPD